MASENVSWTEEQKLAIEFKGNNMLVSAAAGAGKTFVLVEKVIQHILAGEEPCDIERLLVVTFTEKAALEMKERIRTALEKARAKNPYDPQIPRQISLLERAQISTIHSFCLSIVRKYYYRIDLDPGFRVLDSNEAELLRYEALDEVFEQRYRIGSPRYRFFSGLVERYGGRQVDQSLKELALKFHGFLQTQPYPEKWLDYSFSWYEQVHKLIGSLPESGSESASGRISASQEQFDQLLLDLPWPRLLLESLALTLEEAITCAEEACAICRMPNGPQHYLPVIEEELCFFKKIRQLVDEVGANGQVSLYALCQLRKCTGFEFQRLPSKRKSKADPELQDKAKGFRNQSKSAFEKCTKNVIMRPSAQTLKEIAELLPWMKCFTDIVTDLDKTYTQKKKAHGGVDFADLERYSLDILRQDDYRLAKEVRSDYDYIFVDEYQDTNPVQEEILSLVSTSDNLFMVGDIKQSIYRFRLAEPKIFLEKYMAYDDVRQNGDCDADAPGVKTGLSRNFRSRKEVIDAVNYLFERIMKQDVAEIDYTEDHRLYQGASYPDCPDNRLTAELILVEREDHMRVQESNSDAEGLEDDAQVYEALEKEALAVASKIKQLTESKDCFQVWDTKRSEFRTCTYRDIAILMRSTKDRANVVIDILEQCGIPAYSELGTGYFRAREVEVALSLLSVIDNPRQDIPLAAILRSPVVGLTPRQLAIIKAFCPKREFYDSVKAFASLESGVSASPDEAMQREVTGQEILSLRKAIAEFLQNLDRWRTLSRRMPLTHVLWAVLRDTGYYAYVGGLPGGAQRQANLRALVNRAMEFDTFGRHGLFRFLRFIERIQESRGDLGTARALGEQEDVVQILSVHKSKGLEFPVVFVIDLGKQFNMEDLRYDILFHKDLGIGPIYCDLSTRVKYPTLAFKAHEIQIRKDNLAEEMRILYVAMTRAKEKLYLVGSARRLDKQLEKWKHLSLNSANTYLDWICPAVFPGLVRQITPGICEEGEIANNGSHIPFDIQMLGMPGTQPIPEPFSSTKLESSITWDEVKNLKIPGYPEDPKVYPEVKKRLEWNYFYRPFCITPAKTSVGELKSRLDLEDDIWRFLPSPEKRLAFADSKTGHGVERGIAIHALLAKMDLVKGNSESGILSEIERLSGLGFLDKQYIRPEDVSKLCGFFKSPTGQMLVCLPQRVHREVPFTMAMGVRHTRENEVVLDLLPEFKQGGYEHRLSVAGPGRAGMGCDEEDNSREYCVRDSVLIQGVIDLIFETDDGLIILDYKTDSLSPKQLPQAAEGYAPQVALYSYGAERILRQPVKQASIVFLTLCEEVEVNWRSYMRDISLANLSLSKVM